jgi:uncharacterized membrane protein YfcA
MALRLCDGSSDSLDSTIAPGVLYYLDILVFTTICVLVGAVAGFLGGLLGIGGGVVIVPALILLFDADGTFRGVPGSAHLTTLVAVATSLATIVFTAAAAAFSQFRATMVEWVVVRRWVIAIIVGSYLAGFVAAELGVQVLRSLIGAFLLFVSGVMLTSWKPSPHRALPGPLASTGLAGVAGLVSGIAGIGGGNVVVPTLVFHNVPVHRATATSSTLGFPIAIAGTIGYVHRGWTETTLGDGLLGYVYLPAFAAIASATLVFAPLGVRLAHRLHPQPLRRAFGALLLVVALRMIYTALY